MIDDSTFCRICGRKDIKHLGSHIWHKHKILAKEYKMQFGLSLNYPLISPEVKKKKQIAFEEDREKYLSNLFTQKALRFRLKKGHSNTKTYYSKQSIDKAVEELDKLNSKKLHGKCYVCNLECEHLYSHLYNKHGLLLVIKGNIK